MKRNKMNFSIFILFFVINQINGQQCGIKNLFKSEIILNRTLLISAQEQLPQFNNGQQMTIYGWFKVTKEQEEIQLFRLSFKQNIGEPQIVKSIENFIKISYTSKQGNNFINIIYARESDQLEQNQLQYEMPLNEQIFMSISFNTSLSILNVYLEVQNYNFQRNFVITFPTFYIRQIFIVEVGCFKEGNIPDEILVQQCMLGTVKDWNYILSYVNEPSLTKFLTNQEFPNFDFFVFDYQTQNNLQAKNSSKTYQIQGNQNFGKQGQFLSSGKGSLIVPFDMFKNDSEYFFTSGFFLKFKFPNSIDKDPIIFEIQTRNQLSIKGLLFDDSNGRYLNLYIDGTSISYQSKILFGGNNIINLVIGFVVLKQKFQFLISDSIRVENSPYFDSPFNIQSLIANIGKEQLIIIPSQNEFSKNIEIFAISTFSNLAGIAYSIIKQNQNSCYENCEMIGIFERISVKCLMCKNDEFLNVNSNQCISICPKEKFIIEKYCTDCKETYCQELNQNNFQVEKVDKNVYVVSQLGSLPNFNNNYRDGFSVSVDNGKQVLDRDFFYKIDVDEKNKNAKYNFTFNEQSTNAMIEWIPTMTSFQQTNNGTLNQQILMMRNNEKVGSIFPQQLEDSSEDEDQQNQQNKRKLKRRYVILARVAFGLFWGSILVLLIGTLWRCKNIIYDKNNFFNQKLIQTFLMTHFIAFWLLYNVELPIELYSFLKEFFRLNFSWYKIFEGNMEQTFQDPYFKKYFQIRFHERFAEENVFTIFLNNFGIVFIYHLFIIIIYAITHIAGGMQMNERISVKSALQISEHQQQQQEINQEVKNPFRSIKYKFHNDIFVTSFLVFIIEEIVFIVYNFHHVHLNHGLFLTSFIIAIIYLIFIVILWIYVLFMPLTWDDFEQTDLIEGFYYQKRRSQFIWRGLYLNNPQKIFQGIQYFFYAVFALILTLSYNLKDVACSIIFALTFLFCLYVILMNNPLDKFWQNEQRIIHVLLIITKLFFTIIVLDFRYNNVPKSHKNGLGITVVVLIFIIICLNFLFPLIKLIKRVLKCMKTKSGNHHHTERYDYQSVIETNQPLQMIPEEKYDQSNMSNVYSLTPDNIDIMYDDQVLTMSQFIKKNDNQFDSFRNLQIPQNSSKEYIQQSSEKIFSFQNEEDNIKNTLALNTKNKMIPKKNNQFQSLQTQKQFKIKN